MATELLLIGDDLPYLAALSVSLRSVSRNVVLQDTPRPVSTALHSGLGQAQAAIICLTGNENVADVRELMTSNPATTCLFLSRQSPPRHPLVHAIHDCGGEILPREESRLLVTATLISLMASSRRMA